MPKLAPGDAPEVKLDSAAGLVEASLTLDQRRMLFEQPGSTVVAIVELSSVTYTGHAQGEEKQPQVKVRVTACEVARNSEEEASLQEAMRAMYRGRRMDGTLDEVGAGPQTGSDILDSGFAGYPSEAEFRAHHESRENRKRNAKVRR